MWYLRISSHSLLTSSIPNEIGELGNCNLLPKHQTNIIWTNDLYGLLPSYMSNIGLGRHSFDQLGAIGDFESLCKRFTVWKRRFFGAGVRIGIASSGIIAIPQKFLSTFSGGTFTYSSG